MRLQRTRTNLADGDESIGMIVNTSTSATVSQCGQDTAFGAGEAIALLHTEPATVNYARGSHLALVLPREALESRLTDIDDATMRLISQRNEAIPLLLAYLRLVHDKVGPATPELRDAVVTHVYDLVALAVGAHVPLGESGLSTVAAARLGGARLHRRVFPGPGSQRWVCRATSQHLATLPAASAGDGGNSAARAT
jgi:hypothetical protein